MPTFDAVPCAKRLRKLLRAHRITPHQFAVADALLWSARAPGREEAQISYDRLAKLAGVGRSTAVEAVKALRRLGVLSWRKTRLRVSWALGVASRQGRNIYRMLAGTFTEFAGQPTDSVQARKQGVRLAWHQGGVEILYVPQSGADQRAAQDALDRVRAARQGRLLMNKGNWPLPAT